MMPTIRAAGGTSADLFSNLKFADIPASGAILNAWSSSVTNGDVVGLSVGDRDIMVSSEVNIESSADVIDTDRDQMIFNEVVGGGHIFVPTTVNTELQILVHIRYL